MSGKSLLRTAATTDIIPAMAGPDTALKHPKSLIKTPTIVPILANRVQMPKQYIL